MYGIVIGHLLAQIDQREASRENKAGGSLPHSTVALSE